MRVHTDMHARARLSAVFSGEKKERKKKEATDERSSVQICERYQVGRNAEIALLCLVE